jgi:hypothetical protein
MAACRIGGAATERGPNCRAEAAGRDVRGLHASVAGVQPGVEDPNRDLRDVADTPGIIQRYMAGLE